MATRVIVVVIPTYNEADNLRQIVEALLALSVSELNVLVVDDNSPDGTGALADELSATVKIPMVAVLGNHDFESGKQEDVKSILCDAGVTMLDGDACEIQGIG